MSTPEPQMDRWPMVCVATFVALNVVFSGLSGVVGMVLDGVGLSPAAPRKKSPVELVPLKLERRLPRPPMTFTNTHMELTPPCRILLSESGEPSPDFALPRLRLYSGQNWFKEDTYISLGTDGKRLKMDAYCFDRDPASMVDEYTAEVGAGYLPWKDDGVELFLCGGPDAPRYYQFAVSNTGAWEFDTMRNEWGKATMPMLEWPSKPKVELAVTKPGDGFRIRATLRLEDMAIDDLEEGDVLYMQIVRNYRGQSDRASELLQLFPVHIYADNNTLVNHHRKAFIPVRVVTADSARDQPPAPATDEPPAAE